MQNLSESDQALIDELIEFYEREQVESPELYNDAELIDKIIRMFKMIMNNTARYYKDLESDNSEVVSKAKEELIELRRIAAICELNTFFIIPPKLREKLE